MRMLSAFTRSSVMKFNLSRLLVVAWIKEE
jgi:hypothetical protein